METRHNTRVAKKDESPEESARVRRGLLIGLASLLALNARTILPNAHAVVSQVVKITTPTQGSVLAQSSPYCDSGSIITAVKGKITGFTRSDFHERTGSYMLFVNGAQIPVGSITEDPLTPGQLLFELTANTPYYPTTTTRAGTETTPPPARFPWRDELGFSWDKRVRGILAEVVEKTSSGAVDTNLDHYVVRDVVTTFDPRTSNCGNHTLTQQSETTVARNGFMLQFTPKHFKSLESIIARAVPVPTSPTSTSVIYTNSSSECMPWNDLSDSAKSVLRSDFDALYAIVTARVASGSLTAAALRLTRFEVCKTGSNARLGSFTASGPSATVDPSVNPLTLSILFGGVQADTQFQGTYYINHTRTALRYPLLPRDNREISCSILSSYDVQYPAVPLTFTTAGETVYTQGASRLSGTATGRGGSSVADPVCSLAIYASDRLGAIAATRTEVKRLFNATMNSGYTTSSPRHALSRAMDAAIYPLSTGNLVSDAGSGTTLTATPSVAYAAGRPSACELGNHGLYVSQTFSNVPTKGSLSGSWLEWNGGSLRASGLAYSRAPATCPITGYTEASDPIFDSENAYESPLLSTTSPFNQTLSARTGTLWDITLTTTTSADARTFASALGLSATDVISFRFRAELPPFVGPEWYYQQGAITLQASKQMGPLNVSLFKAYVSAFLDQKLGSEAGLGVGDSTSLDDGLGAATLNTARTSLIFHSISSGSTKPTRAQLSAAFSSYLKAQLSSALTGTLKLIGSVEYAKTPPLSAPAFRVINSSRTEASNALLIPYHYLAP